MSEYPQPWHQLDPVEWLAKEAEIHRDIAAARKRGDRQLVGGLLYQLPAPSLPEWLESPAATRETHTNAG